jgi:biopolymer transport protein ExbD
LIVAALVTILLCWFSAAELAADTGHRADDNARPQIDEIKGPVVFIDLKKSEDGVVILVGDGKAMTVKPRQELKGFLSAMRFAGKNKVIVRAESVLLFEDVIDVLRVAETAGFECIGVKIEDQK